MDQSKFFSVLSFFFSLNFVSAQDSLNLFKTLNNQYNVERMVTNKFYYNPANMPDYSSLSMSEFSLNYQSENKKIYLRQLGSGDTGLVVNTDSFKKLKSNSAVWGHASYSNINRKSSRYNENLDLERITPYVTLDSIGGNIDLETYHFSGGYAKKLNRFSLGISGTYKAQMASRSRDPRMKNTTSDLLFSTGINYRFYRNFQIGIFGDFNKYTQNSLVAFVNEVSFPIVYQSIGFGYDNYFFSNSLDTQFEEIGYKIGGQITNQQGKDFYVLGTLSSSNNIKSIKPKIGNRYYDTSDLENQRSYFEAAKFITFQNNRFGLILNYDSEIRTGTEYGYTSNSDNTELIFKRKAYKKERYTTTFKALYQLSQKKYTFTAVPFFSYHEITDRRIYPFSGQKFHKYTVGLDLDLKVEINKDQVLTFRPSYSHRNISTAINALDKNVSSGKLEWINDDFSILASDSSTVGLFARYDFRIRNLPALFVSANWITQIITSKHNNFSALCLGITF
ncbi:hypothetical protein SAMN05444371_3456 [Epilithonimonas mollis]|uniref:DUF6850 domain-containing protein n=2 Tax=Epilithonimonas mollis TaxID=216903 RepID=A0A1M6UT97_9FLAO|nr:hypothetical protein SAMN05444371_3456 [Epilithonimonas mollis]